MKKDRVSKDNRFRLCVQALSFAFHNGYVRGFLTGKICTGATKSICVPGLNCYSCPGASFSCPIGALSSVLGNRNFKFSLYVLGFLGLVGTFFGRLICGFICPFGLISDLLYKIPLFKKEKNLPGHKYLKYLRYVTLILMVVLLPLLVLNSSGGGEPWFCEWICPDGTLLGGIPLTLLNPTLRSAIGGRFVMKVIILVGILGLSVKYYRPFCKYLCPLGAFYGMFNPVATYKLKVDKDKCTDCGLCEKECLMGINVREKINSPECIRCGKCKSVCPSGAISATFMGKTLSGGKNSELHSDTGKK